MAAGISGHGTAAVHGLIRQESFDSDGNKCEDPKFSVKTLLQVSDENKDILAAIEEGEALVPAFPSDLQNIRQYKTDKDGNPDFDSPIVRNGKYVCESEPILLIKKGQLIQIKHRHKDKEWAYGSVLVDLLPEDEGDVTGVPLVRNIVYGKDQRAINVGSTVSWYAGLDEKTGEVIHIGRDPTRSRSEQWTLQVKPDDPLAMGNESIKANRCYLVGTDIELSSQHLAGNEETKDGEDQGDDDNVGTNCKFNKNTRNSPGMVISAPIIALLFARRIACLHDGILVSAALNFHICSR